MAGLCTINCTTRVMGLRADILWEDFGKMTSNQNVKDQSKFNLGLKGTICCLHITVALLLIQLDFLHSIFYK